jgi:hypothetical protein
MGSAATSPAADTCSSRTGAGAASLAACTNAGEADGAGVRGLARVAWPASLAIVGLVQRFNVLVGESLAIGHARWIHEGQFVVKNLDLLVVRDFAGLGIQRRGRVAAKEDATHAPRAVGRIRDARMVFGVFLDNQASGAVQQQLGIKVQPMWLSRREWNQHLVRGHGHLHDCCL